MSSNTIEKAEIALNILLEHEENSDIKFKALMDKITLAWKELD